MKPHQDMHTNLVIVGGGVFGCAIAYYYTRNNPGKKVLLLERNELCNAATSRAAALITLIRAKKQFIPLSIETYRVIPELEKLLGESMHIQRTGVLHVASSPSSIAELESLMLVAEEFKQAATFLSNDEIARLVPWLNAERISKAGFIAAEAYCDPYLLGTFFARAAVMQGAVIKKGAEVKHLLLHGNTVTGVETEDQKIYADKVVLATGAWAPLLALQAGVALPMAPVRSQYWITEKSPLFPLQSPIVILPDAQAYARPEGGSLLFGIREKNSMYASPADIPSDISHYPFSPDKGMQDLSEVINQLAHFFPAVYDTGLQHYIAGFSGYTPDNYLSMGIATNVQHLLLATGCVGAGISVCGGVGLAFAEMAANRPNPFDFTAFDIQRFGKIDPLGKEWLQQCAEARSKKKSG
ncbi:MAG: FAD-binding oxidoreductase [Chitinophagaceae bacterium]|nr:FAD-binding oxidoreductase [Chitinophagaceae bacterium]